MKYEYVIEKQCGIEHEVDISPILIELAEKLSFAIKDKTYGPILINDKNKSVQFQINLATNRVEKEIGTELYIVNIKKYGSKLQKE